MILKSEEGTELQLPTVGKLQEMAGIKASAVQEDFDLGHQLPKFLREDDTSRPPLAERIAAESEAFVKCVKYLRGELDMPSDKAYDYALRILLIDRY